MLENSSCASSFSPFSGQCSCVIASGRWGHTQSKGIVMATAKSHQYNIVRKTRPWQQNETRRRTRTESKYTLYCSVNCSGNVTVHMLCSDESVQPVWHSSWAESKRYDSAIQMVWQVSEEKPRYERGRLPDISVLICFCDSCKYVEMLSQPRWLPSSLMGVTHRWPLSRDEIKR